MFVLRWLGVACVVGIGIACGGGGDSPAVDATQGGNDGPPGVDAPTSNTTDSEMIGPAGGTLTVDGAVLTIPPNALATPTLITLTRTTRALAGGPFFQASPVYDVLPAGQTFSVAVSLSITYANVFLPAPPNGVLMHWSKTGVTPQSIDDYNHLLPQVSGNTVTATNTHGGEAAAAACKCSPDGGGF